MLMPPVRATSMTGAVIAVLISAVCFNFVNSFSINKDNVKPVFRTNSGFLRGEVSTSRNGQSYYGFRGIPYAEPPGRFEIAQPKKPWNGVRDTTRPGSVCPQMLYVNHDMFVGKEDCLFLDVYTPADQRCNEGTEKLPVLFFIPSGAFIHGSGSWVDPKFFMDECVVFVAINYRLGVLGFLTTEDDTIPGNLGLKDALLALKWTHENIKYFRGNKDAITLHGQSAGAAMVSHLIASPAAKGLFHRAIAQSGSSLNPFGVISSARTQALHFGSFFNCSTDSSEALANCLKTVPVEDIAKHQEKLKAMEHSQPPLGPVVEPSNTKNPFQNVHPYLRLRNGDISRVPLLTGVTEHESLSLLRSFVANQETAKELTKEFSKHWRFVAPDIYDYRALNVSDSVKGEIADRIRKYYMETNDTSIDIDLFRLLRSVSDRYFDVGVIEESELHAKYAPVYSYLVGFHGNYTLSPIKGHVTHSDDLQYLFPWTVTPEPEAGTPSFEFSQRLIKLWVSFAATGFPSALWPNATQWPKYEPHTRPTLVLNSTTTVIHHYNQHNLDFWKSLRLRELEFGSLNTEQSFDS